MTGRVSRGEIMDEDSGVGVRCQDMVFGDGFEETDVAVAEGVIGGSHEGHEASGVIEAGECRVYGGENRDAWELDVEFKALTKPYVLFARGPVIIDAKVESSGYPAIDYLPQNRHARGEKNLKE